MYIAIPNTHPDLADVSEYLQARVLCMCYKQITQR